MPDEKAAPGGSGVPPGAFLRDPPPESAAWQLSDWQRWFVIDLLYRMELDMYQRGMHELGTRGFTTLAIPGLIPTWEDAERVFDRVRAEQEAEDA